ncbi:MAG: lamin tail domain-containing protein, partial [Deltaproteobacteria bacterium]|nr:lamin tail domain-containing protein [Deltaproteobacteria bacterium]
VDGGPADQARAEAGRFVLIAGEIGPAHLGQLARDEISAALTERLIPTVEWQEHDGTIVLAPTIELTAGEIYSVACGMPKMSRELTVARHDELPHLDLLWPPDGVASQSSERRLAVWCGDGSLPPLTQGTALLPTGEPVTLRRGATAQGRGHRCIHVEPDGRAGEVQVVAPPLVHDGTGDPLGRLEPTALRNDGPAIPFEPSICDDDELPIGPGCARVADDRMVLRAPAMPLLWSVTTTQPANQLDVVMTTQPGEYETLGPLPPASAMTLLVDVFDLAGRLETTTHQLTTAAPMAHVVLNEVLANPVGEEPEQEWVELTNDGLAAAELGGYVLTDIGGETVLPEATLLPGAFALVVNEDFDETSDYDPTPAPSTLVLRVAKLGKGGLNNQGEPLKLWDGDGNLVSRFPATPKPKSGISVIRITPGAPDGNESSFMRCPELPTPGAPNLGGAEGESQ